jgi:hypothetical protein
VKKPKRCTDEQLDAFIEGVTGRFISIGGKAALELLTEIKDRRSRDLTADEVEALKTAQAIVQHALDETRKSYTIINPLVPLAIKTIDKLPASRSE